MAKHKIIILVPSFNDLESLKKIILKIKKKNDVLVLDDCSTDQTLNWLKKKKINFIRNKRNLGYTKNILNGMKFTLTNLPSYNYILTMDADGEHKISNIKKIIKLLEYKKKISIIVGVRNKFNRYIEYLISSIFYHKYRVLDPLSGFKIYEKNFLKKFVNKVSDKYFLIDLVYLANLNKKIVKLKKIQVNKRNNSSRIGNFLFANIKLLPCIKWLFYSQNILQNKDIN